MKNIILATLYACTALATSHAASANPEKIQFAAINDEVVANEATDMIPARRNKDVYLPIMRPGLSYEPAGPHHCGETITVSSGHSYTLECTRFGKNVLGEVYRLQR